jgi:hypothetical protein
MKVKQIVDEQGRLVGYRFHCPGCDESHTLPVRPIPRGVLECPDVVTWAHWLFNEDLAAPTFSPSVSIKSGHYCDGDKTDCWCTYYKQHPNEPVMYACFICHSFVRNGRIEFLHDCTHALAGQTVDLPDIQ